MGAIFLSASVPIVGRGDYHLTADPFLIQCAVRELMIAVLREKQIVWGGHPAITPMIWSVCEDLDLRYADSVILYQSRFFEEQFPIENANFGNVNFVDAVPNDRDASLRRLREAMLSREDLVAAVFVGGMEGVEIEHDLFRQFHSDSRVVAVGAPGGAARVLAERSGINGRDLTDVDFAALFRRELVDNVQGPQTLGA